MFFTVSLPIFIHFRRFYPRGGTADGSCVRADPRASARTPRGQLNSAPRTRIWRGHGSLKILKHKYLTFLRVENAGFTSKHCYRSYSKVPPPKGKARSPPSWEGREGRFRAPEGRAPIEKEVPSHRRVRGSGKFGPKFWGTLLYCLSR